MRKTPGQLLRASLKRILVPALLARGFVLTPYSGEDANSRATKIYFPFGKFWRRSSDGDDLLVIQIDKYGPPSFSLSFGVVPDEQPVVEAPDPSVLSNAKSAFWPGWLEVGYDLCSFPYFLRGFRVEWWQGKKQDTAGYDELVQGVVKLLPEVDDALVYDRCGRHIRRFDRRPNSKLSPKEQLGRLLEHFLDALTIMGFIATVAWAIFGFIIGHSLALFVYSFIGVFIFQIWLAILENLRDKRVLKVKS